MAKEKLLFDDGHIIACTEYAAKYFGVSSQTMSNWAKAGCPQHAYGYWDIRAVTEYRQLQQDQRVADDASEGDLDKMTLAQQKTYFEGKLKAAQLESAEFRNAINKGDYLPRQEVVGNLKALFLVLKRQIQALGRKLSREIAGQLSPVEARLFDSQITQVINDALEGLSEGVILSGKTDD